MSRTCKDQVRWFSCSCWYWYPFQLQSIWRFTSISSYHHYLFSEQYLISVLWIWEKWGKRVSTFNLELSVTESRISELPLECIRKNFQIILLVLFTILAYRRNLQWVLCMYCKCIIIFPHSSHFWKFQFNFGYVEMLSWLFFGNDMKLPDIQRILNSIWVVCYYAYNILNTRLPIKYISLIMLEF